MNHLSVIQSEFLKQAATWNDLSYEAQVEYLRHHPKSKRRMTKSPGQIGANLTDLQHTPEIQNFDQQSARLISDHITATIKKIADEYGMTVRYGGGRYDNKQFKLKFELNIPTTVEEQHAITTSVTDQMVQWGQAPIGTKIITWQGEKATIVGRRRTNYLIDKNGRLFRIKFRAVKVDPEVNPAASQQQRMIVRPITRSNITDSTPDQD